MIIFDLDGTLANCDHRKHFVDPLHPKNIDNAEMLSYDANGELVKSIGWKPDWKAFYEACDKDTCVYPSWNIFHRLSMGQHVEIWTGRCESVRSKTVWWFMQCCPFSFMFCDKKSWNRVLKMRTVGDSTPDDKLKEKWLDEALLAREKIDFVFDDHPEVIRMWRRRGIFVFNCSQSCADF